MTERIGVPDAPPPPPPPPPPDDGKQTPDVSPELANSLTNDDPDSYAAESRPDSAGAVAADQHQHAETPATTGPDSQTPDPPRPDAPAELRSAMADPAGPRDDVARPDPVNLVRDDKPEEMSRGSSDVPPDGAQDDPMAPAGLPGRDDDAGQLRGGTDRADDGTTDNPLSGRPDVAAQYPDDYRPAAGPLPRVDGPHENPGNWAGDINPDKLADGGDNNCGECARAVDNTWNGEPTVAAALSDPEVGGEQDTIARMTDWAGEAPAQASMPEIQQRLQDLGPGSSAVVGCDWNVGGGHWFNAVNDEGTVKAVDGQRGLVETWPPSVAGLGFDESSMSNSDAIFFTPDGKVVKNDH